MSALWSAGEMAADSMPYVRTGTKQAWNTLSFHLSVMLLLRQNRCSVLKPVFALAILALMSLCVLVSSVMMTPRYVTCGLTLTAGGCPVEGSVVLCCGWK